MGVAEYLASTGLAGGLPVVVSHNEEVQYFSIPAVSKSALSSLLNR